MRQNLRFYLLLPCTCFILCLSNATAQESPRIIGAIAELSGSFSAIGEECKQGWHIAEKRLLPDLKGSVKILYGDSQRDPRIGINEFRRLTDIGQAIGIIFNGSPVAMTLNPISSSKGIPILGSVSHPKFTEMNPFAFRLWTTSSAEGKALAKKALQLGSRRLAVVTLEDEWPITVSEAFKEEIERGEGEIVFSDTVRKEETDFLGIVSRIRPHAPDAVFVNIVGDQLAAAIRRFRELGFRQQLFTSWSLGRPEVLSASPPANAEGTIFVEMDGEQPWLKAEMKKNFGSTRVTSLQYGCFLAMWTMLSTLHDNHEITDSKSLYSALTRMHSIATPDGPVHFKARDAQLSLVFRQVENGLIVRMDS